MRRPRAPGPIFLSRPRRLTTYGVCLGIWASGASWLVTHYFLRHQGAYGPEANPTEVWQLRAHGLFAFAFLWLFGLLWGAHVVNGWAVQRKRWSGGALFAVAGVLIASGYLLYYLGDEALRPTVSLIHWIVGLAACLLFGWHRLWRSQRA